MRHLAVAGVLAFLSVGHADADECPGHPDALGTSRTIVVDPTEHPRIGTMQYRETLPLADHEVVLTFDDGPMKGRTDRVLDALAAECVKATFFVIGHMAKGAPDLLQRVHREGHSVGTHTQNHPLRIPRLPIEAATREIEEGIASAAAALGDPAAVAPFFRIPGLGRTDAIEAYAATRGLMVWSADAPADDWRRISPQQVIARSLERLERKRGGVLLLHDMQPATVLALPELLRELKRRNFRIVHVVPAGPERPKTVTAPEQWAHLPLPPGSAEAAAPTAHRTV